MKRIGVLVFGLCAGLFLITGCGLTTRGRRSSADSVRPASPPPSAVARPAPVQPVVPTPAQAERARREERKNLDERIGALENTVQTQRKLQVRLENDLVRARDRLSEAQADVRALDARSAEIVRKIEEGSVALAALRDQFSGASLKQIADLDARLAEEQRRRETQAVIVQQREKEINDLRQALRARDDMLRRSAVEPSPAPAAAPLDAPPRDAEVFTSSDAGTSVFDPTASASSLMADASRLLKEGDVAGAEQRYAAALARDPKLVDAKFGVASCRYTAGDLVEAKRLVGEVLRAAPRNAQALGLSGIIAWRQGDLRLATKNLSRAVKLEPQDALLHNHMGVVLYAQNNRADSMQELLKAVELNPNLAEARFNLAIMFATDNPPRMEDARQHYQASLRLGSSRDTRLEKILYQ